MRVFTTMAGSAESRTAPTPAVADPSVYVQRDEAGSAAAGSRTLRNASADADMFPGPLETVMGLDGIPGIEVEDGPRAEPRKQGRQFAGAGFQRARRDERFGRPG